MKVRLDRIFMDANGDIDIHWKDENNKPVVLMDDKFNIHTDYSIDKDNLKYIIGVYKVTASLSQLYSALDEADVIGYYQSDVKNIIDFIQNYGNPETGIVNISIDPEFIGCIIDIIEDYFYKNDEEAHIVLDEYDSLEKKIRDCLSEWMTTYYV